MTNTWPFTGGSGGIHGGNPGIGAGIDPGGNDPGGNDPGGNDPGGKGFGGKGLPGNIGGKAPLPYIKRY